MSVTCLCECDHCLYVWQEIPEVDWWLETHTWACPLCGCPHFNFEVKQPEAKSKYYHTRHVVTTYTKFSEIKEL